MLKKLFIMLCGIKNIFRTNDRLNKAVLNINTQKNNSLKKKLAKSYERRSFLFGEGSLRMSNDYDISLYYRWPVNGDICWLELAIFNSIAINQLKLPIPQTGIVP